MLLVRVYICATFHLGRRVMQQIGFDGEKACEAVSGW